MTGNGKDIGLSYSRFSDPKQSIGDSEDRQQRDFAEFCERHHLRPAKEHYSDRGLSGFKDRHRTKGAMGRLEALAKSGKAFPAGTVLVVEAWDRLGRLPPDRMTAFISGLLQTGLKIGICRLNDIFSEEDFGTHKWTTLSVFIQLAYQESQQKSERVAASWLTRRKRARSERKLMTTRLPAWLECVNGTARVVPERAAVVKRIFALAASGYGHTKIAQTLTREGVPAFGVKKINPERKRSQFSGKWTRPYLSLLLNDRRALGEFQPAKEPGRQPDGAPIQGYYPCIVSPEEFALARAGQERRLTKDKAGRSVGPRQRKYLNLFAGLLHNAADGEGFVLHNKGTTERPELVLICASGAGGRGPCITFPYPVFERGVVSLLREVRLADIAPPEESNGPRLVDVLKARLAATAEHVANLKEDLRRGYSRTLADLLREKEDEHAAILDELEGERARVANPMEAAWDETKTLLAALESAADPEDARLRLKAALRRVAASVDVLIVPRRRDRLCCVQMWFAEGGRCRTWLLYNKAASNNRQGGWWAGSLADEAPLDLRRAEHASAIADALEAVDLSDLSGPCDPGRAILLRLAIRDKSDLVRELAFAMLERGQSSNGA